MTDYKKQILFQKRKMSHPKWWFKRIFRFASYIILFDLAFIFLFPYIHMITTAVKSPEDLLDISIRWIPSAIYSENFKHAFDNMNFLTTFSNSLFVSSLSTLGHLLSCSFVAYGFARFKFPMKKPLFALLILSIIIPIQTIIVPIYKVFSDIGFVGSQWYAGIIVPSFMGFGLRSGLFIFVFYSHFQMLPKSTEEAAYIDGANAVRTFFKIIVPSSMPAFLVSGVLSYVWHWNDYYEPSLYITDSSRYLVPQMLPAIIKMQETLLVNANMDVLQLKDRYNDAVIAASMLITLLPLLVAYMFVQHKFVEGVVTTGMKE